MLRFIPHPVILPILVGILLLSACISPPAQPVPTAELVTVAVPTVSPPTATTEPAQPTIPLPPTAAPTATPSAELDAATEQALLAAIWADLKPQYPEIALLVGLTGRTGDYASAEASPADARPLFVYLQQLVDGSWQVVQATSTPSAVVLEELGVPEELTLETAQTAVQDAAASYVRETFGMIDGYLSYPQVVADHARLWLVPTADANLEIALMFFEREGPTWQYLTSGSAFAPEDLQALGIPEALWQAGEPPQSP
jgi:hypothetical protein